MSPSVSAAASSSNRAPDSIEERIHRLALLAIEVGVNLAPGQFLLVAGHPEHLPLIREITRLAYERGAGHVEVTIDDPHVRRERIRHANEESLDWSPPWTLSLLDHLVGTGGAYIAIGGDPEPELMNGLDPARVAKTRPRTARTKLLEAQNDRQIAWTIIACPTTGWAKHCLRSARPAEALGRDRRPRPGSTSPIRWRRGATTSRASGEGISSR